MVEPILTDIDLENINNALSRIDDAEQQIVLAKRAGVNVSRQEQDTRTARERLMRIKNVYFPNAQ